MYSLIVESLRTGDEIRRYPADGGKLLTLEEAVAILPTLPTGSGCTAYKWRYTLQGWLPDGMTLDPFIAAGF